VLDADIAKCFDRINHKALLEKLNTFPTLRRQIRAWLQAGVMDSSMLFATTEGTPQGGVISPLLANIALHGMENRIKQAFPLKQKCVKGVKSKIYPPVVIRYADDFVILHEDITVVQRCQQIVAEWLNDIGLELKPSKTRLAHTLDKYEQEEPGFDFLGFSVRQYPVGKHQSGKHKESQHQLGFKTLIKPSKNSIKQHSESLAKVIRTHKSVPQSALIRRLNPVIRGWANYFSTGVSKEIFSKLENLIYEKLRAWANFRHPNKRQRWVTRRYWKTIGNDNWSFAVREEDKTMRLIKHTETRITRHVKVQGERSPYDGDWVYWSTRMGKHPEAKRSVSILLKEQKGKCPWCGLFFKDGDRLEIDHKIPKSQGGKNSYENLNLLHRHCHDHKTAHEAVGTQELNEDWLDTNPF
jgi:RNA-directed DNA polymerase